MVIYSINEPKKPGSSSITIIFDPMKAASRDLTDKKLFRMQSHKAWINDLGLAKL